MELGLSPGVRHEKAKVLPAMFENRRDAGRKLAQMLLGYRSDSGVLVLALPRGGVPVAFEVANGISAPLDVLIVRKLGFPQQEELAMGAIASGGVIVMNELIVRQLGISATTVQAVAEREGLELARREQQYRGGRPAHSPSDKTVILVDDGLATGASMKAAVTAVRQMQPHKVVVAVPIGSKQTCDELRALADEVVCFAMPEPFQAVGIWYEDFNQTSDEEVRALLESANKTSGAA